MEATRESFLPPFRSPHEMSQNAQNAWSDCAWCFLPQPPPSLYTQIWDLGKADGSNNPPRYNWQARHSFVDDIDPVGTSGAFANVFTIPPTATYIVIILARSRHELPHTCTTRWSRKWHSSIAADLARPCIAIFTLTTAAPAAAPDSAALLPERRSSNTTNLSGTDAFPTTYES